MGMGIARAISLQKKLDATREKLAVAQAKLDILETPR
jgi:hypothetical protein